MNKVVLVGRTTKEIELKHITSDNTFARFSLAVNRRSKNDGTDFISCVVWNKTAELMEKYVRKGHRVGIIGRIQTGSYEKDGKKYYSTDVVVDELEFLETKNNSNSQDEPPQGFESVDEDIPF